MSNFFFLKNTRKGTWNDTKFLKIICLREFSKRIQFFAVNFIKINREKTFAFVSDFGRTQIARLKLNRSKKKSCWWKCVWMLFASASLLSGLNNIIRTPDTRTGYAYSSHTAKVNLRVCGIYRNRIVQICTPTSVVGMQRRLPNYTANEHELCVRCFTSAQATIEGSAKKRISQKCDCSVDARPK